MQLAWDEEDSTQVAIKFVARGSAYLSRAAEREILNHRLLTGHAHIVQFKEVRLTAFAHQRHSLHLHHKVMTASPVGNALERHGLRFPNGRKVVRYPCAKPRQGVFLISAAGILRVEPRDVAISSAIASEICRA